MDKIAYKPVKCNQEATLHEAMGNEEFRKEYESLEPNYAPVRELLLVRQQYSRKTATAEAFSVVHAEGK